MMESTEEKTNNKIWKKQDQRWLHPKDFFVKDTPSRVLGMSQAQEEQTLQVLCNFLQDMGQRLGVTQLCINTACVYLRRFFSMVDIKRFNKHLTAAICLFLAAKVEEQPRKLEHLIQMKVKLVGIGTKMDYNLPVADQKSREAQEIAAQIEEGKLMENALLKLLGFDLQINHPHTYVVRGCQMLKASKDFAQTAYFLATNSLHLTNMCITYKSPAVACVCIHLAAKWARYQIPQSIEGKDWFNYIASDMTKGTLLSMASELMHTFEQSPDTLKRTFRTANINRVDRMLPPPDGGEPDKKRRRTEQPSATVTSGNDSAPGPSGTSSQRPQQPAAVPSGGESGSRSHGDPKSRHSEAGSRPHGDPNARLQHQPSQHQPNQHAWSHHRPGSSRPVAAHGGKPHYVPDQRQSSSHDANASSHVAGSANRSVSSSRPNAPPTSGTMYDGSAAPSVKLERSLAGSESQDRHTLPNSHSQPNLTAPIEPIRKAQKLSIHDYQQRKIDPSKAEAGSSRPDVAAGKADFASMKVEPPSHLSQSTHPLQPSHPSQSSRSSHHPPHSSHPAPHPHQQSLPAQRTHSHPIPSHQHSARDNKTMKKESSSSSVPDNLHLKEAKVLVQDLKDSHGQDRVMYADANRRRSLSQSSREGDEGEAAVPISSASGSRHSGRGSQQTSSSTSSNSQQPDQRKVLQAARHHSGKGSEEPDKVVPLKLHIKRDSGTLLVKNPGQDLASSSSSSSSKSSPLKMKIRRNPETAAVHEVAPQPEPKDLGLKLRLQVPSPGNRSSSGQDRHSHHHVSHTNGGLDRKYKHASRSHTQLPGKQSMQYPGHPSSGVEASLHRSASASHVAPPPPPPPSMTVDSGVYGNSQSYQQRKGQSSRPPQPPLKTQHSGFSLGLNFDNPVMPDNIFEPDTPTDLNGFEAPPTPTADNFNRVNAQMQQMLSQTKASHVGTVPYHPPMGMHQQMYSVCQPPLPPPLPDVPPPRPPPPPQ